MKSIFKKQTIVLIVLCLSIVGIYNFYSKKQSTNNPEEIKKIEQKNNTIGSSVEGRKIEAYTYGSGAKHLIFIGGIHGGYELNSVMLAEQFVTYLNENPTIIPQEITLTIIPSANPDGVFKVKNKLEKDLPEGAGRFNANEVDLNRNFDCKWQPESTWRKIPVSAGSAPFSEPETKAIKDFIFKNNPVAVIFWHSQSNAVYASECENGILPETLEIMNIYAKASGYPAVKSFNSYTITGDAEGWLASINIPAITVELKNHEDIEWKKNLNGIMALLKYYAEKP